MAGDQTVLELIETMQEVSRLPLHAHLSAMARGELFVLRFLERHEGTAFPAAQRMSRAVKKRFRDCALA